MNIKIVISALTLASTLTFALIEAFSNIPHPNNSIIRSDAEVANRVREKETYAEESFELPTELDLSTIENNQLHHPIQTFSIGRRCVHGFPQAYGNHPVAHKVNSGLFRLTCPMLVCAIDTWENEGGVREMSDLVRSGASVTATSVNKANLNTESNDALTWMDQFQKANERTSKVRKSVIESFPGGWEKVQSKLGEENSERFLESGIAGLGVKSGLADVKCLHAHVADHLCRSTSITDDNQENVHDESTSSEVTLGYEILHRLAEQRGVSTDGTGQACWKQCTANCGSQATAEDIEWDNYTPKKNRQKLRSTRKRRKEIRENE